MSRFRIVGPVEARALAACGVSPIWARSGPYKQWVICDEGSSLYDFGISDEEHAEMNHKNEYKINVE